VSQLIEAVTVSTVPGVDRDQGEAESRLAQVARDVWGGVRGATDFMDTFTDARVYMQRPAEPGRLLVADLGDRGSWMVAFSTLARLGRHVGVCDYFATTGADLLELVPPGVGVMVDPGDEHRFPVLARMAPPDLITRAWAQATSRRTAAAT
jgi:hypothetical protein